MIKKIFEILFLLLLCGCAGHMRESVSEFNLASGIRVRIVEAPFSETMFRVELCPNGISVCRINGKVPHGGAVEKPKTYLKELMISYKGKSYKLDSSNMFNAWGKRPLQYPTGNIRYFGGHCHDENLCVVGGLFADGGATFVAEWKVVDGIPERTVITESDDAVELFMVNIDPPKSY
jgi:hypothetical protein